MSFNAFKTLALSLALLSVVACGGKGVGQKNNLDIDGTYKIQTADGEGTSLVQIKDNVATYYDISDDKKNVEVTKQSLLVKGNKLTGSQVIDSKCDGDKEFSKTNATLKKKGKDLIFSNGSEQEVLKAIDSKEFDELTKDAKEGKLTTACLDGHNKLVNEVKEESTAEASETKASISENKGIPKEEERSSDENKESKDDSDSSDSSSAGQSDDATPSEQKDGGALGTGDKIENSFHLAP